LCSRVKKVVYRRFKSRSLLVQSTPVIGSPLFYPSVYPGGAGGSEAGGGTRLGALFGRSGGPCGPSVESGAFVDSPVPGRGAPVRSNPGRATFALLSSPARAASSAARDIFVA